MSGNMLISFLTKSLRWHSHVCMLNMNLALHRYSTASLTLSKGNKICLLAPPKLADSYVISHLLTISDFLVVTEPDKLLV